MTPGETTETVRGFIQATRDMMMGRIPIDEDAYDDGDEEDASYQEWVDEEREWELQAEGGEIAWRKLDAMSNSRGLFGYD